MSFFFVSNEHRQRFLSAVKPKIWEGKVDPEYGAAFYILSADEGTWNDAAPYITREGIDFEGLLAEVDFSAAYRDGLIKLAGNLFNSSIACSPVDFYRLDDRNFTLALNALQIRRHNWPVEDFSEDYSAKKPGPKPRKHLNELTRLHTKYTDAERAEDEEIARQHQHEENQRILNSPSSLSDDE